MGVFDWLSGIGHDISNFVNKIGNDFANSALGQFFHGITNLIRDMLNSMISSIAKAVDQVRIWEEEAKFHLSQAINDFYNTDAGFWVVIFAFAVAVVVVPEALKAAQAALTKAGFFTWLEAEKASVASWGGWAAINTVVEANKLAQVLFSNWRTIWTGIYQDVGGIASDIGLGIGSIAAAVTATKGLLATIYTTMGADPNVAELSALTDMSNYLTGLSQQFDRYAQNPQDIWNDLWEKVILPKQGELQTYQSQVAGQLVKLNNDIQNLQKLPQSFQDYQASLQKALNIQLNQHDAAIEQQFFGQVNAQFDAYNKSIGDKIDSIAKSVDTYTNEINKHNTEIADLTKKMTGLEGLIPDALDLTDLHNFIAFFGGLTDPKLSADIQDLFMNAVNAGLSAMAKGVQVDLGIIDLKEAPKIIQDSYDPNFIDDFIDKVESGEIDYMTNDEIDNYLKLFQDSGSKITESYKM